MKKQLILILVSVLIIIQFQSFSQNEPLAKNSLNFFLDCHDCDFTFVRQELKFVSFVRDPKLADVHIMSSESNTGSGGKIYYLNFIGHKNLEGEHTEYKYFSQQSETEDETRKGLLNLIKTGILQYYSKSGLLDQINIDLEVKEVKNEIGSVGDPWKLWVFRIETGGDFQKEESQNEYSLGTELRIEKVTESWKTQIEAKHEINRENYFDDGEKIVNNQTRSDISTEYIKSLTPKWSAGIFGEYSSASYKNIKDAFQFDLGAEYNIFPWDVSNRKVFTLRYTTGIYTYNYNNETIYNKLNEKHLYEAMKINLELVQPWGDIDLSLEGRHFFYDFKKNRFTFESDFSVRLSKQISIYSELQAEVIHDQLYLPKGSASLEDLLLKRRKLATTYEISGEVGLRLTFGSIYNNVVNERF